jgi:CotH kinase protein/Secretion system C-terminal sorting domain
MKKSISLIFLLISALPFLRAQNSSVIDTDLPLLKIHTRGGVISNDPKITADFSVINNGSGRRNKSTDTPNEYNGKIGVEFRGQSSQGQPLRSYDIELRDATGLEVPTPLLGMPPESDWVLYAPYMDKTMMRNYLAYTLTREMGRWASRVRYVELILNDEYQGIYLLTEKIKRDSSRVNISRLLPTDNSGIELTGGYIFSLDKEPNGWFSSYPTPGAINLTPRQFSYVYPKAADITPQQKNYIKQTVDDFERALNGPNFQDPSFGVRKHADLSSFIDFFIINEISRNVDGYRLSSYFHKNKNVTDGRIKAGPAWDFDLAFKNADYCDGSLISGWAYKFNFVCPGDGSGLIPFWWDRLMLDTAFVSSLRCRWLDLRKTVLSEQNINKLIDSADLVTTEARTRHFAKWNLSGNQWWRGINPIRSYGEERDAMKAWIKQRTEWIDFNLQNKGACGDWPVDNNETIIIKAFPNPFQNSGNVSIQVKEAQGIRLMVIDINGRTMTQTFKNVFRGTNNVSLDASGWPAGIYQIILSTVTGEVYKYRMVKQ